MNIPHRRRLDWEQIGSLLAAAGIDPGHAVSCTRLTDANFNTAFRVGLDPARSGRPSLVLKVAPAPETAILSYEHRIMHTEAMYYRTAAGRAPVPEVLHADFTRDLIDTDFLVLSDLPGANWHAQREHIGEPERERLRTELGGMVAALHHMTGTGFGYPQAPLSATWRAAFLAMVDALLADADAFAVDLPETTERIREIVTAAADPLDEVRTPVLVHFDLWDGNILVDRAAGRPWISGLVDGERAFWGDPLAEFVSLALFGDVETDPHLLNGYRSAGGRIEFDTGTRQRLAVYRCYLYLIMLVESVPRGLSASGDSAHVRLVTRHLRAELDTLAKGDVSWRS
ncbi:phosphotransferase family protein [Salinactinospora qingdaonensis]|uniref:Aminoglycoside phosphotransferase family protein n=1 Tax=Salinactinospora qingdaonensis TaxID=702744 RepID=A0ABP7FWU8_9ACTN